MLIYDSVALLFDCEGSLVGEEQEDVYHIAANTRHNFGSVLGE